MPTPHIAPLPPVSATTGLFFNVSIGTTLDAAAEPGAVEAGAIDAGGDDGAADDTGGAVDADATGSGVRSDDGGVLAWSRRSRDGSGVATAETGAFDVGNGVEAAGTTDDGGGVLETRSASSFKLGLRDAGAPLTLVAGRLTEGFG